MIFEGWFIPLFEFTEESIIWSVNIFLVSVSFGLGVLAVEWVIIFFFFRFRVKNG